MFSDGLDRQFGRAAVQEANRLLKGWMEFPFSMVGRTRNTGHLSKLDRALEQAAQGRAPHTSRRCRFTDSRSIPDRFHRMHIAQKAFSLLFIQERIIKRGKQIWLPIVFFWNTGMKGR
jgi:hypothetical protein